MTLTKYIEVLQELEKKYSELEVICVMEYSGFYRVSCIGGVGFYDEDEDWFYRDNLDYGDEKRPGPLNAVCIN